MKIFFEKSINIIKKTSPAKLIGVPLALVVLLWCVFALWDVFGITPGKGHQVMVKIPAGSTVLEIADILDDEGIIDHAMIFRFWEKLGRDNVFQQGGHLVGRGQSYGNIIKKLTSTPDVGAYETVTVVIPEGYEARMIAKKLSDMGLVDEERFMEELEKGDFDFDFISEIDRKENRLEGYLFPATYELMVGESEHDIINRMLTAFNQRIVPLYKQSGTSYSLDEIVTMASIVEREAANDSERGKVASVFYNRLKNDMAFGSCATVQYIIKERKDVLSNSDIKIKSPYNTYINKGLPIGPIASPGESSVKAALYPEDTDYLYFAARADGSENVFTRTNEEHLQVVQQLQN